jgi:hypothetical protein
MKRKTLYTEQYVDCEYDVDFNDLLELIESCDDDEKAEIRRLIGINFNFNIKVENLYDVQKQKLLEVAFEKYNLDELMEKLQIKNSEY